MPPARALRMMLAVVVGLLAVSATALGVVAPVNTTPPSIPSPRAYLANTATAGTWGGDAATITYQWQVSTGPDAAGSWTSATGTGSTTITYTPVQGDAGKYLRLKETASNGGGTASAYSSVQYVTRPDMVFSRNFSATGANGFSTFPVLPATSALLAGVAAGSAGNSSSLQAPVPDPTGAYMFVGDNSGTIQRFPVKPDGTLGTSVVAATCSSGDVTYGVITPDAQYAYFLNKTNGRVCQYAYDAAAATLTPMGTPSVQLVGCGNTQNMILSPTQSAVYVACRDGGIAALGIGAGGALTALAGSPFGQSDGIRPTSVAITPDGKNIYATQYDSGQWIRTFAVNPATGIATYNSGASFTLSEANGVAALSNTVVYAGTFNSGTITRYVRNAVTGALSNAVTVTPGGGQGSVSVQLLPSPDGAALYFGGYYQSVVSQYGIAGDGQLSPLSPFTQSAAAANTSWLVYSKPTPSVSVFQAPSSPVTQPVSTLTYTLALGEPASGLAASDFLVGGTSPGWTVQSVTGQGAGPYTVTLAGGTADGTVSLSLAPNAALGVNGISGPAGVASASVVTLNRPPMAAWTTVPATPVAYASSSPLDYTVTFNKPVQGISSSSFTNTGTATGCVIATPVTSGQTVTSASVTVTGCSPGTVILTLGANAAVDAGSATGPAAADAAPTVTINPATTATWVSTPGASVPFAQASSLAYTIDFSAPVRGVAASAFTTTGTATGCVVSTTAPALQLVSTANVTVAGCSAGTVVLTLRANALDDEWGTPVPTAATAAASVTIQPAATADTATSGGTTPPAVTAGIPTVAPNGVASAPVTCTGPPQARCVANTSLIVGGAVVATGSTAGPVSTKLTASLPLPTSLQGQLARTGRVRATVRVVGTVSGVSVTTERAVVLRAAQGTGARGAWARPRGSGLAATVHAVCVGGPAARCSGTWRLVFVRAVNRAVINNLAVAGTARFRVAPGRAATQAVVLNADGRAMTALCRRIVVRAELTVGKSVTRTAPFEMGGRCGAVPVSG